MEIGLAQHVSNKMTLDVPTDAAHLFTVIEQWYWTLGSYKNTPWGPSEVVCIHHHSDGLKYKAEPGQHILGFDINGQSVGRPETLLRGLLHIDAIELTPQLTRLWLIPKGGFDDLANGLITYIREAYDLDVQVAETSDLPLRGKDMATQTKTIRSVLEDPKKSTQPLGLILFKAARDIVNCAGDVGILPMIESLSPGERVSREIMGYTLYQLAGADDVQEFRKYFDVGLFDYILPSMAADFLRQFPTPQAAIKKFNKPVNLSGTSPETLAAVEQLLNLTVEEAQMLVFAKPLVMQFKESLLPQGAQQPQMSAAQPTQPSAAKPANEKRRGGPIPTPDDVVDAILKEWDEVKGRESQESFCSRKGIGVSTLGAWQRKRKS